MAGFVNDETLYPEDISSAKPTRSNGFIVNPAIMFNSTEVVLPSFIRSMITAFTLYNKNTPK
jgi:hypothetical protein